MKEATWLFLCFFAISPVFGQDADICQNVMQHAEDEFFHARFDNAARALEICLTANAIAEDTLFEAHLLRARIYYAAKNETRAADAVEEMFNLHPGFIAGPPLPPPFIAFVEYHADFRKDRDVLDVHLSRTPSGPLVRVSRKGWLMIGGGVLVTGAAMALFNGGGEAEPPGFPAPPAPPRP